MSLSQSLAELNEINDVIIEIRTNLGAINKTAGGNTTADSGKKAAEAQMSYWNLYLMVRRFTASLRRLGLPENVDKAMGQMQQVMMIMHSLVILSNVLDAPMSNFRIAKTIVYGLSILTQMGALNDSMGYDAMRGNY